MPVYPLDGEDNGGLQAEMASSMAGMVVWGAEMAAYGAEMAACGASTLAVIAWEMCGPRCCRAPT